MRQPMSPDYSRTYIAGSRKNSRTSQGRGSRRSSKKSLVSRKSSTAKTKRSSQSSRKSSRKNSRKNSRRSSTSRKSSATKKPRSRRSSVSKQSGSSKKSSRRGSRSSSQRSSNVRRSTSGRRSSVRRYDSQRTSSNSRSSYDKRRNSGGRRTSEGSRRSSGETVGAGRCQSRHKNGRARKCSENKNSASRSSYDGGGAGSRRSSGYQKLSSDLARKLSTRDGSKSPWGSRRESLNRIVQSKEKYFRDRVQKNYESNLPSAQKKALRKRRYKTVVFRNPKPRKYYDSVCHNCHVKFARNQCVYTNRRSVCQQCGCGPKSVPRMMYLIKRAIAGRLYGANVKEMAHFIRSRYGNQVPRQGLQIRIKCTITRMIALHYIQKNPRDFGRYILTPQGRSMKLQNHKLSKYSSPFYKNLRKEKMRSKHRFLRQHTR